MKKLLGLGVTCILLVAIIDIAFGAFCNWYLKNNSLSSEYENIDYLIKRCTDDIIVLGSSAALHNIVPSSIEDSLGLTCFNGGAAAQDIPFYYSIMECVLERHRPSIFVLAVHPYQFSNQAINYRYKKLMPYYGKGYNIIDSCLEARGHYEPYFLKSSLYRYNYIWLYLLSAIFKNTLYKHSDIGWCNRLLHYVTSIEIGKKGYVAMAIPSVYPTLYESGAVGKVNEQRKEEFIRMAEECRINGVQLVVCVPPELIRFKEKTAAIIFIENYCKLHDIPYFNDLQNQEFLNHNEWFYDNKHLNKNGAPIYTELLIKNLRNINKSQ